MRGAQDRDLFSTCVSDLVMESREFEMLLGKIQPDGSRKPGCIDKFQRDTSEVISFVAAEAEAKGLYEDSVRLYDLAKASTCGTGTLLYTHHVVYKCLASFSLRTMLRHWSCCVGCSVTLPQLQLPHSQTEPGSKH